VLEKGGGNANHITYKLQSLYVKGLVLFNDVQWFVWFCSTFKGFVI
jgi:hypothetical protein